MNKEINNWVVQARYDLDTARSMLESGRFLYVLFCCQQAIEKIIKALIAQSTSELPPRIHNLVRLSEAAGLQVDEERTRFLRELSTYYFQTRYPEEISSISKQVDAGLAKSVCKQTEEVFEWLESMLT
jgi:HEPN domain-containing protein